MQVEPRYADVVSEVRSFLDERIQACVESGIARDRLVVDPGIGFGKRLEHNLALLAALAELVACDLPVLVGVSRKSMFGALLGGRSVEERLAGSLAATAASVLGGAKIIRTHDVRETVDAVKVAVALRDAGYRTRTSKGD
jgi:dihydropteroate synthase